MKNIANFLKKSPWDDEEEENIFQRKRNTQMNFDNFELNFSPRWAIIGLIALVLIWLSSGIYKVQEGEQGAVLRFGKFHRISMPGLNYHLPNPIEKVIIEKVNKLRRIEIGYRSTSRSRSGTASTMRDVINESNMLTGDENVVELNVDLVWSIANLSDYIFNVAEIEDTVKSVAESAIREVIGNTSISSVLSNQKQEITERIESLIQRVLNQYASGVKIDQVQLLKAEPPKDVIQAYRDVQTARADKEKEINQAQSYNNDVVPKARGEAAKIQQEAEGYRAEVIARAKGDSSRFNALYKQYVQGKTVTRSRMYIEAVEDVLKDADKVVMEGNNVLPHMAVGKSGIIDR